MEFFKKYWWVILLVVVLVVIYYYMFLKKEPVAPSGPTCKPMPLDQWTLAMDETIANMESSPEWIAEIDARREPGQTLEQRKEAEAEYILTQQYGYCKPTV